MGVRCYPSPAESLTLPSADRPCVIVLFFSRRCGVDRSATPGGIGRRSRRRRTRPIVALAGVLGLIMTTLAGPASAAPAKPTPGPWKATPLAGGTLVHGAKSESGRLAKSDAGLLAQRSSKPVNVVVKLDYDALTAYRGGVPGLAATSPAPPPPPFPPK